MRKWQCRFCNHIYVGSKGDPDHHVITAKLLANGTRAAICGVLCPRALPYPWPGQYAHQSALTGREGGVLGITLDGRYTPYSEPFEAAIPVSGLVCNVLGTVFRAILR